MAVHLREPGRRGTDSGGVLRGVSPCHGRPSPGGGNRRDRPLCRPPIAGRPHRRRGAAARQPPQDPRPPLARRGGPGHHHPPGLGACPLVSPPRSSAGGRAGARLPRGDVHLRRLERDALFQWGGEGPRSGHPAGDGPRRRGDHGDLPGTQPHLPPSGAAREDGRGALGGGGGSRGRCSDPPGTACSEGS